MSASKSRGSTLSQAEVLAGEVYNQVHTRDVDLYTMHIPDFATDRHFGEPQDEINRNV